MGKTLMERLPVFVIQAGQHIPVDPRRVDDAPIAVLVSPANCRPVATLVSGALSVDVTVEGMTNAFEQVWTDHFGFATMRIADDRGGRKWFVFELDSNAYPAVQLLFDAEQVAAFLADVALAACSDWAATRGGAA